MKTTTRTLKILPALVLICLLLQQCNPSKDSTYQSLMDFADQVKVINTHEHQHWLEDYGTHTFRLPHLINVSYLNADIVSAGGARFDMAELDSINLDQYWEANGKGVDYARTTSYYSHLIKGFQKLYDFEDLYLAETNINDLSAQVEDNYSNYRAWFDEAFQKAGFELMFLDQYWNPFNTEVDEKYYALVFHINQLVMHSSGRPAEGDESWGIYKLAEEEGFAYATLDEYLSYCDHLFSKNIEKKAVCVKNSMAYSRTQYFEDVSYEVAQELYTRPLGSLSNEEAKKMQDFMFHWVIQKSVENDLPIQIHTGYLAGNGNTLDNGKPLKLNNLFLKYPEAKFVLFHGGYPWTGEFAAFGKMFANVYLDLVWLPQISREEAVHAVEEMLDCVPYNKFFWGGDCGLIEESTGSLEFGKEVVAEVLANRIERGLLTEEVAHEMIQRIFRENAIEVFRLEKILGRSF